MRFVVATLATPGTRLHAAFDAESAELTWQILRGEADEGS
jgi:hypothetical protein